jgi:hypothetical protein
MASTTENKRGFHSWMLILLIVGGFISAFFLPPSFVKAAWTADRASIRWVVGEVGEQQVFAKASEMINAETANTFAAMYRGADSAGVGDFGNADVSSWAKERTMMLWFWWAVFTYRMQLLIGWVVPAFPLMVAFFMDGYYVREIRKSSFVAQSPVRHKIAVRTVMSSTIGTAFWTLAPIPLPVFIPIITVISASLASRTWISNLQKRI